MSDVSGGALLERSAVRQKFTYVESHQDFGDADIGMSRFATHLMGEALETTDDANRHNRHQRKERLQGDNIQGSPCKKVTDSHCCTSTILKPEDKVKFEEHR